jgi:hypothetical protein
LLINKVNQIINKLIYKIFLMLGNNILYEQRSKISGYKILNIESPIIKTIITDNVIINKIRITGIVIYYSRILQ